MFLLVINPSTIRSRRSPVVHELVRASDTHIIEIVHGTEDHMSQHDMNDFGRFPDFILYWTRLCLQ